jgi:hypothetical protein
MAEQPAGMTNSNGVILSAGFFGNGEAFEIVLPLATNSTSLDDSNLCQDAAQAFEAGPLVVDLLAILSSSVSLVFVAAEGMTNGCIPWRDSFAIGVNPGTSGPVAAPTNACALGVIYQDPADVGFGTRIAMAKTFFSGIATTQIVQNSITTALVALINTWLDDCQGGFPSILDPTFSWYRVLTVPKPRTAGTPIKRLLLPQARGNIYTQKRRLVPRP